MTDPADVPDLLPPPAPPEPPRKKGHPVAAWIAIILLVCLILWRPWESPIASAGRERFDAVLLRLQGRNAVGAAGLFGPKERSQFYGQLKSLDTGPVGQRLRFIVLAGELAGPDEALERLRDLQARIDTGEVKGDPADTALLPVPNRLYGDYAKQRLDAPSVPAAERERLRERLGWFGQLALAPRDGPDPEARAAVLAPAQHTALVLIGGVSTAAAVGLFGFTGLVLFLILLFAGRLREGLPGPARYGGVYAEAFALWMGLYVALSLLVSWLKVPGPPLLVAVAVSLLCLFLGLAWPLLRGVPWGRLRQDVGLTFGRNPALEPVLGLACYAMALPMVFVGALLMLGLLHLRKYLGGGGLREPLDPTKDMPYHPISGLVGDMNWQLLLQLLLLASVTAPLVEETMFRGLLYRHLREATGGGGRVLSIVFSAFIVSFLFAGIHPQGWPAIPVLMALALSFTFMREWRGTLIPSMVAHGLNNGLALLLFYFALGS
jgi:membrane protease YdiL (CAAX protease family)